MNNQKLRAELQEHTLKYLDFYGKEHINLGWVVEIDGLCYEVVSKTMHDYHIYLSSIGYHDNQVQRFTQQNFKSRVGKDIFIVAAKRKDMVSSLVLGNKYTISFPNKLLKGEWKYNGKDGLLGEVWQCMGSDGNNNSQMREIVTSNEYILSWGELNRLDLIGAVICH